MRNFRIIRSFSISTTRSTRPASETTALVPTENLVDDDQNERQLSVPGPQKFLQILKKTSKVDKPLPPKPVRPAPKRLPPLPSTGDILKLYRLRARKHLSQNFLMNPKILDRLVDHAKIREGSRVVEIGPGPGNITRRILERNPKELYVIEKDRRFLPMLEQLADAASPGQMKIILGDVLDYSLEGLFPESAKKPWDEGINKEVCFVANLPFAVSIPLLIRWLRQMSTRSGPFAYGRVPLTLTFQKEVAMRIQSPVLSYWRSRISIMAQTFCKIDYRFTIKGSSFTPEPQVDVGVLRLVPLAKNHLPLGMDFKSYEKFVRTFIHYRRFPIEKAIRNLFPKDKQHLMDRIFEESGFQPSDLPGMLSTEEVANMARIWFDICKETPGLLEYDYRARKAPPRIVKEMFDEARIVSRNKYPQLQTPLTS
jgi:dimethyladenosine transferase 1